MAQYNRITAQITTLTFIAILFSAVLSLPAASVLVAQDFRVEAQVFVAESATPISENLTLFSGQVAYDFHFESDGSNDVAEIVIFDTRNRQFVLLDLKREIRTDIAEYELLKMVENQRGVSEIDEDTQFLLNPQFETQVDRTEGLITLSNDDINYRVQGTGCSQVDALAMYMDVMDQLTRLSASDPERLPPFARLAVNREIRRNGMFPSVVEVTYRAGAITRDEFNARSKHTPVWQLSNDDRQRIQSAKQHWMQFEKVSLASYRGIEQQANK